MHIIELDNSFVNICFHRWLPVTVYEQSLVKGKRKQLHLITNVSSDIIAIVTFTLSVTNYNVIKTEMCMLTHYLLQTPFLTSIARQHHQNTLNLSATF